MLVYCEIRENIDFILQSRTCNDVELLRWDDFDRDLHAPVPVIIPGRICNATRAELDGHAITTIRKLTHHLPAGFFSDNRVGGWSPSYLQPRKMLHAWRRTIHCAEQ